MEEKVYIITNCGGIVRIFDDEDEMRKEYQRLWDEESKYQVTHYYYNSETMTRAEFICHRICGKYEETIRHNAEFMSKNTGKPADECYEEIYYRDYCNKCVLCKYSPHKVKGKDND